MKPLATCFQRGMRPLSRLLMVLSALLLTGIVVLMNLEVFTRYFLNSSIHIADEYAGYMFCALTLLSFLPTLRSGRFLQITGAIRKMPLRVQALAEAIAAAMGAGLSAVFAWVTAWQAWQSYEFDSVSLSVAETPLAIPQAILPIGFVLLALGFIDFGLTRASQLWRGQPIQEHIEHVVD
ncbi:MAG: TRAP transporter small permease [Pusillimonas sp.]